jgi:GrpB-like predicted nucleotidyltransferase (UPF0157 family)
MWVRGNRMDMPMPSQRKVLVVDYDSTWPLTFATLQAPIAAALGGLAFSVEHVGSTSVPGLAAKPIIDIDVVVPSRAELPAAIESLTSLGYEHCGNLGIEDREAFESPPHLPAHHLYACVAGCAALANHLAIRDHLRRNPATVAAYSQLKKQLAERFPTDIESYVAGKTDFLLDALRSEGFSDAALRAISDANRKK